MTCPQCPQIKSSPPVSDILRSVRRIERFKERGTEREDQEAFESTVAGVRSASITSAKVRWSGKIQFSPGSTSRAPIGESGNNSGRAFFHLAKATLFAISRSFT